MIKHTMHDRTPYTYLLKFKPTGQVYYGCRYGKGCHPSDLFLTYFTSSKIVKKLILVYGIDAFSYEVRRIFHSKQKCIEWEQRILHHFNVLTNTTFLNIDYNINASNAIQNKFKVMGISNIETGVSIRIPLSESIPNGWVKGNINNYRPDTKGYIWYYNTETNEEFLSTTPVEGCILGRSPEKAFGNRGKKGTLIKITDGVKTKYHTKTEPIPEGWYIGDLSNTGSSGKFWITNGVESKYHTDITPIPTGWYKGRHSRRKS